MRHFSGVFLSSFCLLLSSAVAAQELAPVPRQVPDEPDEDEPDEDEPDEDQPDEDQPDEDEPDEDEPDEDEPDEDEPDEDEPDEDEPDEDEPDEDEPDEDDEEVDAGENPSPDDSEDELFEEQDDGEPDEDAESQEEVHDDEDSARPQDARPPASPTGATSPNSATAATTEAGVGLDPNDVGPNDVGSEDEDKIAQAVATAQLEAPPPGPSLLPLKVSTSTWSRFEYREGYERLGVSRGRFSEGDLTVFRARLGFRTHPLPISDQSDVLLQFSPQASGHFGQNGTIGEAQLGLYEGYLKFRTPRVDVQIGRMKLDYGEGLIIGALDWNEAGRAFDGGRVRYKMDHGTLDFIGTQVAEGAPAPRFLEGDQYFWGAYLQVGDYLHEGLDLDVYYLGLSSVEQEVTLASGDDTHVDGAHLSTAGLRFKGKTGVFDYRLEADIQWGGTAAAPETIDDATKRTKHFAQQADLELGLSWSPRMRVSVGGVYASGDDPDTTIDEGFDQLYPTGHKFLGLMDVIGDRDNVVSGNVKVHRAIIGDLALKLDGHVFARLQRGGVNGVEDDGFAGFELDTQLVQQLGRYAQVRGLYGLFLPGSGHYPSDDAAHYVEIQTGITF